MVLSFAIYIRRADYYNVNIRRRFSKVLNICDQERNALEEGQMTFEEMIPSIEKMGINLYGIAFYQDGRITEHRFRPCANCHNCYSVAKAFTMTAIGMLQDDGLLDVRKPVYHYMAELIPADADPAWRLITVEQVMKHTVGFGEGFLDIDVEDVSAYPTDDYLDIVFHHKLTYLPGQKYQYSDAAYYLLSRLVSAVSGEKLDVFLNRRLFQPLKFQEAAWSHCPKDYPMGATGLYISATDMVKLGALYMEGGVWQGKRILSEKWVHRAIGHEYELRCRTASGLIGKGGMYGQQLLFNPEKKFAVAWHTHEKSEQIKRLMDYIDAELE